MSDRRPYLEFAIADFSRVRENASACKSMLGAEICDAVINALKKEIPVPALKAWDKSIGGNNYYRYVCPECENVLRPSVKGKYCPYCGQRIEWEENHERK